MKLKVAIILIALLAGCVDPTRHLDDRDDPEVPADGSTSDTKGQTEGALAGDTNGTRTQNATRSMLFDNCQQGQATGYAPSYGFPFPAAPGWERTGDEIPQSHAYLRVARCDSASVLGLETLDDVSFGWFSSNNVSHNATLDGLGYNELQAATALFCSRALCEYLSRVGYHTTEVDIRLRTSDHSIEIELPKGQIVVDLQSVRTEPGNGTLPWRFLVVPVDAPGLWFSADQDEVVDELSLPGTWSSEGTTPMGNWLSKQPSGTIVEGSVFPDGSLEVKING